jgi:hypothetical protein
MMLWGGGFGLEERRSCKKKVLEPVRNHVNMLTQSKLGA